jgi:hypothetical protein
MVNPLWMTVERIATSSKVDITRRPNTTACHCCLQIEDEEATNRGVHAAGYIAKLRINCGLLLQPGPAV